MREITGKLEELSGNGFSVLTNDGLESVTVKDDNAHRVIVAASCTGDTVRDKERDGRASVSVSGRYSKFMIGYNL